MTDRELGLSIAEQTGHYSTANPPKRTQHLLHLTWSFWGVTVGNLGREDVLEPGVTTLTNCLPDRVP